MKLVSCLYHLHVRRIDDVDTRITLVVNTAKEMCRTFLFQLESRPGFLGAAGLAKLYGHRLTGRQGEQFVKNLVTIDKLNLVASLYRSSKSTKSSP